MKIKAVSEIVAATAQRHVELNAVLAAMSDDELDAPSLLPGWSRTTIVCHLRYGAQATHAMVVDALAGTPTAFYPLGRAQQRPSTLRLRANETPTQAVESLKAASAQLDSLYGSLDEEGWSVTAVEPADNPDLGTTTLGLLALLRLTEAEVHGYDLNVGAGPWSDTFIDAALPMRVHWLPTRRSNQTPPIDRVVGTWVLRATDGTSYAIRSTPTDVSIEEDTGVAGDVELAGSKHDLLAWLLGRFETTDLLVTGDLALAQGFHQMFPAP